LKRNLWIQYAFIEWTLPFEVINVLFGIASWYFLLKMYRGTPAVLKVYGGDPIAYVILGMAFHRFLVSASGVILSSIRSLIVGMYSSGGSRFSMFEYIRLARISARAYVIANFIQTYLQHIIICTCYLLLGLFVFGIKFNPSANYIGAVIALMLGIMACIGIGMISASIVILVRIVYGVEPISWSINLLSSIVSGVYFPPEILPSWLKVIAYYLPHTYAMNTAKLAILAGYDNSQLLNNFITLSIFALLLLSTGIVLAYISMKVYIKRGGLL